MEQIKLVLKYFEKIGYPNKNVSTLFNSLDYDSEDFLPDLVSYLGEVGAEQFVRKTIEKLNTPEGIKIDLSDSGYDNSYIYLKIKRFWIDFDESDDALNITYEWGNGQMTHPDTGEVFTKEQVYQDTDIQEWNDVIDTFEGGASHFFYNNCGYWLYFQ